MAGYSISRRTSVLDFWDEYYVLVTPDGDCRCEHCVAQTPGLSHFTFDSAEEALAHAEMLGIAASEIQTPGRVGWADGQVWEIDGVKVTEAEFQAAAAHFEATGERPDWWDREPKQPRARRVGFISWRGRGDGS